MKNILLAIVFILVLGQLSHFGMPWWGIAPVAAVAGWLFPKSAGRSIWAGLIGGFLLWLLAALWQDLANNGLLATKIGALFNGLGRWQILLVTGMLGGLLAGLASLTGFWARGIFSQPEK